MRPRPWARARAASKAHAGKVTDATPIRTRASALTRPRDVDAMANPIIAHATAPICSTRRSIVGASFVREAYGASAGAASARVIVSADVVR